MGINSCVVVLVMMSLMAGGGEAANITCSTVLTRITPCLDFLRYGYTPVPAACCNCVKDLYVASDRQATCKCVKSLLPGLKINPQYGKALPAKCAAYIPPKYSSSLYCSEVQ